MSITLRAANKTTKTFTCITRTGESEHFELSNALSRAIHERAMGNGGDVCGPNGWIYLDGRFLGNDRKEWEILEVGFDEGRGNLVLRGYNRNHEGRCDVDCVFHWSFFRGQPLNPEDGRFGLEHARVTHPRGADLLRLAGFDVVAA